MTSQETGREPGCSQASHLTAAPGGTLPGWGLGLGEHVTKRRGSRRSLVQPRGERQARAGPRCALLAKGAGWSPRLAGR